MASRLISTTHATIACDVCGRNLLRGERSTAFVDAGERRTVCNLCVQRAEREGWQREGAAGVAPEGDAGRARRLLRLFRPRFEPAPEGWRDGGASARGAAGLETTSAMMGPSQPAPLSSAEVFDYVREDGDDALLRRLGQAASPSGVVEQAASVSIPAGRQRQQISSDTARPRGPQALHARSATQGGRRRGGGPQPERTAAAASEARHVRGIPSETEHQINRALTFFNSGEHPRTIAGIARSLGAPLVAAAPTQAPASVSITIAWELCWYRFEVDLTDELTGVRLVARGAELDELSEVERMPNAIADDRGELHRL